MTEEKQGAAEWLREKAHLLRTLGEFSCKDLMTYEFGISSPCNGRICRDCYADMFERIADRIDREMAEKECLKKENAELRAKLEAWKGNAEGFQPDAYMKLPLDADGEPVRIGDEVNIDGDAMTVLGYRLHNDMLLLVAKDNKESSLFFTPEPSSVRHFKPEPADSWEKLEEDMMRGTSCLYFRGVESALKCCDCPHGIEQTGTLCWKNERIDILKRAKKLAKVGEVE